MIKFYTNRELSEKLKINLARWKRWSREFLPPDPLGGIQSGYARQYSIDSAFKVYLGGFLVGELKYTIPEAKKILEDLKKWLKDNGFYINTENGGKTGKGEKNPVTGYIIFIAKENDGKKISNDFSYKIRGTISDKTVDYKGCRIREERYIEEYIRAKRLENTKQDMEAAKMLNITEVQRYFKICLKPA
jgi:hypothetical protein